MVQKVSITRSPSKMRVLLLPLLILLTQTAISHEQSYPVLPYSRGSCHRLEDHTNMFGNRTAYSSQGLLPSLFIRDDTIFPPSLKIVRTKLLCETIGLERNTASSVSFLVEYQRQDSPLRNFIAQVMVDCVRDPHNPNANYSFHPVPAPGAVGKNLNTAQNSSTLIIDETSISANFATIPKFRCGHCEIYDYHPSINDQTTKCTGKR